MLADVIGGHAAAHALGQEQADPVGQARHDALARAGVADGPGRRSGHAVGLDLLDPQGRTRTRQHERPDDESHGETEEEKADGCEEDHDGLRFRP